MTGYYDAVLLSIPVALFGLSGVSVAFGLSVPAAAAIGGLVAAGLTSHALFVNAPDTFRDDSGGPPERPRQPPIEGAD